MSAVEQAVASGDPESVRSAAHSFKGSVLFLGEGCCDAARQLELMGANGQLDGMPDECARLRQQLDALNDRLQEFIDQN